MREGDVFGRTVNIASRLQGHAAPGEVLVSREVMDACEGSDLSFEGMGPIAVKGVAAAIDVYRLTTDAGIAH